MGSENGERCPRSLKSKPGVVAKHVKFCIEASPEISFFDCLASDQTLQVFKIPVLPGDVIVAGTDGLFDNLYNNEITAIVVDAVRSGLEPQATAQKIAALARQRAMDRKRQTPFATAAQEAGFRYYGGKLDDITVVVSYIC